VINDLPPIDTCALAIQLGASFVARSFSGDPKQLKAILKAAISHRGTAMIDVLSPCVTFNDHDGSTKSYSYAKDHEEPLSELNYVPFYEDIAIDYDPGTSTIVTLHDGSRIVLTKMAADYVPTDRLSALRLLNETAMRNEFATGIFYVAPDKPTFIDLLGLVDDPLARLDQSRTRPGKAALDEIMESFR
jgi:2-oxoglutarate ferredoxin oxidoreductase subunit beta